MVDRKQTKSLFTPQIELQLGTLVGNIASVFDERFIGKQK
jgi:hypothetical protein